MIVEVIYICPSFNLLSESFQQKSIEQTTVKSLEILC